MLLNATNAAIIRLNISHFRGNLAVIFPSSVVVWLLILFSGHLGSCEGMLAGSAEPSFNLRTDLVE